jgi:hypothetical protein
MIAFRANVETIRRHSGTEKGGREKGGRGHSREGNGDTERTGINRREVGNGNVGANCLFKQRRWGTRLGGTIGDVADGGATGFPAISRPPHTLLLAP